MESLFLKEQSSLFQSACYSTAHSTGMTQRSLILTGTIFLFKASIKLLMTTIYSYTDHDIAGPPCAALHCPDKAQLDQNK